MREIVQLLIAASSLMALVACCRQPPSGTQAKGRNLGAWGLFVTVFGGFLYDLSFTPKGQAVQLAMIGVLSAFVLLQLVSNSSNSHRGPKTVIRAVAFAAPAAAGVFFVINALMNPSPSFFASMSRLGSVAFLLLIVSLCILSKITIQIVARGIILAVLSILIIGTLGGVNWRACDQFKCGPFDAIYTGSFSSENGLAIIVALGILCVLGSWGGKSSWMTLFPLVLTLFATESRTSQLALMVGAGTWLLLSARRRYGPVDRPVGSAGLWVAGIAGLFTVGLVLTYTSSRTTFSNRGNIWLRGTQALGDDWVFGLGLERWIYLQKVGFMPGLFPHSQYLLTLFSGGVLALLLLFIIFASAIKASAADARSHSFIVSYAVFLGILGLTEIFWNPIAIDGHTFIVIPFIVAVLSGSHIADPQSVALRRRSMQHKYE